MVQKKKHFLESVFSSYWVSTVGIFSKSKDIFSNQIYERVLYRGKQVVFIKRVSVGCLLTAWSLQSWSAIILCISKRKICWSPWEFKVSYKFNPTILNIVNIQFWAQKTEMLVTAAPVHRDLVLSRAVCRSLHWGPSRNCGCRPAVATQWSLKRGQKNISQQIQGSTFPQLSGLTLSEPLPANCLPLRSNAQELPSSVHNPCSATQSLEVLGLRSRWEIICRNDVGACCHPERVSHSDTFRLHWTAPLLCFITWHERKAVWVAWSHDPCCLSTVHPHCSTSPDRGKSNRVPASNKGIKAHTT